MLSQARAQSCVDYLIEKGIPADRLTTVGMGEGEPFTILAVTRVTELINSKKATSLQKALLND